MHFIKLNISYITFFVVIQIYQFCLAEQKTGSSLSSSSSITSLSSSAPASSSATSATAAASSSVSSSLSSTIRTTTRDEIYIDDEGIEGSGGRGEIHDDLEKEPENSGSGFGPDDEDSSSNHYNPSLTEIDTKSIDAKNNDRRKNRIYDENSNLNGVGGIGSSGTSIIGGGNDNGLDPDQNIRKGISDKSQDATKNTLFNNEVLISDAKAEDRTASFFAQPGILAAVIGGAVVGLLCAILVVMFIVYRMRKKDEGSYALEEPKRSPAPNSYAKNGTNREFYA